MTCSARTGRPCRCERYTGTCIRCRQDVSVTAGENAPSLTVTDKGKLVNYTCLRCR